MINLLRRLIDSALGKFIAIAFLAIIAIAFAAGDITSMMNGGVSSGNIARVGKSDITVTELSQAAANAVERQKAEAPDFNIQRLVAMNGLQQLLDELVDTRAIREFGRAHGIIAGKALVDSEITQIPAFRGLDGKFSEQAFRALLQQRGVSEKDLRDQIGDGLIARQILVPASFGARVPAAFNQRYAAMYRETRVGEIALLPSAAFAPTGPPSDGELARYYAVNRTAYTRPERRTLRYALFGEEALKAVPAPSDSEIAARYNQTKAQYAPSENRDIAQLILPTEAAAKAVAAAVQGGKSLDAAAQARGLAVNRAAGQTRDRLAGTTSADIAGKVFAAKQGALVGPVRSPLGWHVVRVEKITRDPGKTLEQAKPEIVTVLAEEKKRAAVGELSGKLQDQIDRGATLDEAAKSVGATVTATPALVANGTVYGSADAKIAQEIAPLIAPAFAMEREGQPQVAELVPGKTFAVFDVGQIQPSAPAPLAEIKTDVVRDFIRDAGFEGAKAAAQKLRAAAPKGVGLAAAMAGLKLPGSIQTTSVRRDELAKTQQVPPALNLMFSMAYGTTKAIADPRRQGYLVVGLEKIEPGAVAPQDPLLAQVGERLGGTAGRELSEELRRAIRKELGVTTNDKALADLAKQLTGGN